MCCKNGTGAGTPIADLMFAFMSSRVFRKVVERLIALGLAAEFVGSEVSILGFLSVIKYTDLGASYVDDCEFSVSAYSFSVCVDKVFFSSWVYF